MYMVRDERLKKILKVLSKRQKDLRVFMENVKNEHNFSAIISISLGSEKWVFLIREDN